MVMGPMTTVSMTKTKKGFQIDSGWIALSANELKTERAPANHRAVSKVSL